MEYIENNNVLPNDINPRKSMAMAEYFFYSGLGAPRAPTRGKGMERKGGGYGFVGMRTAREEKVLNRAAQVRHMARHEILRTENWQHHGDNPEKTQAKERIATMKRIEKEAQLAALREQRKKLASQRRREDTARRKHHQYALNQQKGFRQRQQHVNKRRTEFEHKQEQDFENLRDKLEREMGLRPRKGERRRYIPDSRQSSKNTTRPSTKGQSEPSTMENDPHVNIDDIKEEKGLSQDDLEYFRKRDRQAKQSEWKRALRQPHTSRSYRYKHSKFRVAKTGAQTARSPTQIKQNMAALTECAKTAVDRHEPQPLLQDLKRRGTPQIKAENRKSVGQLQWGKVRALHSKHRLVKQQQPMLSLRQVAKMGLRKYKESEIPPEKLTQKWKHKFVSHGADITNTPAITSPRAPLFPKIGGLNTSLAYPYFVVVDPVLPSNDRRYKRPSHRGLQNRASIKASAHWNGDKVHVNVPDLSADNRESLLRQFSACVKRHKMVDDEDISALLQQSENYFDTLARVFVHYAPRDPNSHEMTPFMTCEQFIRFADSCKIIDAYFSEESLTKLYKIAVDTDCKMVTSKQQNTQNELYIGGFVELLVLCALTKYEYFDEDTEIEMMPADMLQEFYETHLVPNALAQPEKSLRVRRMLQLGDGVVEKVFERYEDKLSELFDYHADNLHRLWWDDSMRKVQGQGVQYMTDDLFLNCSKLRRYTLREAFLQSLDANDILFRRRLMLGRTGFYEFIVRLADLKYAPVELDEDEKGTLREVHRDCDPELDEGAQAANLKFFAQASEHSAGDPVELAERVAQLMDELFPLCDADDKDDEADEDDEGDEGDHDDGHEGDDRDHDGHEGDHDDHDEHYEGDDNDEHYEGDDNDEFYDHEGDFYDEGEAHDDDYDDDDEDY